MVVDKNHTGAPLHHFYPKHIHNLLFNKQLSSKLENGYYVNCYYGIVN